jgi:hypothetical protein
MRRVACLHTADSNIAIFDMAAAGLDLALRHTVRADLLAAAEKAGGLTPDIVTATETALRLASEDADIVLLACSTLGPVADRMRLSVPVRRIDRALAEAARDQAASGRIAVLYTFPGTRDATEALFREVAGEAVEMRLVEGAWDAFKSGDRAAYLALIAAAADDAVAQGVASVAFAQASMAPAYSICRRAKPLTSPYASLAAARR